MTVLYCSYTLMTPRLRFGGVQLGALDAMPC